MNRPIRVVLWEVALGLMLAVSVVVAFRLLVVLWPEVEDAE